MSGTPAYLALVFGAAALVVTGCADDDETASAGGGDGAGVPAVVVTTNILGDVVREVVGDAAEVEVVMPLGTDPHDFEVSAQQAEAMVDADFLVVNGAGFEETLLGTIESVEEEGVPTFAFADHMTLRAYAEGEGEDEHAEDGEDGEDEEAHAGEEDGEADAEGEDEHAGEQEGDDPHVWTDPAMMADAVEALGDDLAAIEGIDADAVTEGAAAYAEELRALDTEIEEILAAVPDDRRVLVTNHEVFGYFADRYDFEVVGAVIPSGTTQAEPSSAELEALADTITDEGVGAIFAETTGSTALADALAEAVGGDIEVTELFTESLGEEGSGAETYVDMMRLDAELIRDALA